MKVWFALKFHLENPLIDYINTLVSFVALNFIFLLCCIPVITIAPALTAMYTVTLHEVKGENVPGLAPRSKVGGHNGVGTLELAG